MADPFERLRREVAPALADRIGAEAAFPLARLVVDRLAAQRGLAVDAGRRPGQELLEGFDLDPGDLTLPGRLYAALLADRHGKGSYYTPRPMADWVVRRVLGSRQGSGAWKRVRKFNPRITRISLIIHSRNWRTKNNRGGSETLPYRRGAVNVLDPAMGAGHFLLAAAEALAGRGADVAGRRRVLRALHGVDADAEAVTLARLTLWLWLADPGTPLEGVPAALLCADSLLEDLSDSLPDDRFDAVVGNPPYRSVFTRASDDDVYTRRVQDRYPTATGSFDLAVPFVERAVRWARPGGRIGLVLPNKLLAADYAADLRTYLTAHTTVEHIADYTTADPFAADVYPVAIVLTRGAPNPSARLDVHRADGRLDVHRADGRLDAPPIIRRGQQSDLSAAPGGVWSPALDRRWSALRPCFAGTRRLDEVADLHGGLTVAEAYDLRERVIDAPFGALPTDAVRLITTGVIGRYRVGWGRKKTRFLKRSYHYPSLMLSALPPRRRDQARAPKIIVAGLSQQPRALVDLGLSQASVSTTILTSERWPLGALCALLNATLIARLYRALYGGLALSGGYLRVGKRELAALPVPALDGDDPRVRRLDELARQAATADPLSLPALDGEVDALVCDLYGVDLWAVQSAEG